MSPPAATMGRKRLHLTNDRKLSPAGYSLRFRLAEGGIELTPAALEEALVEAETVLEATFGPDYGDHAVEVADEVDRQLQKRFCDHGRRGGLGPLGPLVQ